MPETYQAADLAAAIPIEPGQRVLLPQSAIAPADLADALTAKGATVRVVSAYRTVAGDGDVRLAGPLARGEVDAVVFASSSAVDGFVSRLRAEGIGVEAVNSVDIVCIGRSTAATARKHGIAAPIVPDEQTLAGVVRALESVFAPQPVSKGMIS
jgi:uroporphyrinogen-III synthase